MGEVTRDNLVDTLIAIGDYLDLDYQEARQRPGKPSSVYIEAIQRRAGELARICSMMAFCFGMAVGAGLVVALVL